MPKSKPKPRKLDEYVECIWTDAVVDHGWSDTAEDQKSHEVWSVGWVLKNSKKELVLAADVSNDDVEDVEHNRRIVIPKGWIKKLTKKRFGG